jgi:hypothetical protein
MKINLIKCNIPIIWLDSSIIIKVVKCKNNTLKNKSDLETIPEIYNTVKKLADSKKLICPIADQREEIYWNDRMTLDILSSLSKGIKFKFRLSIEKYQVQQFMKAYIDNSEDVTISYINAFRRDPLKELMEDKKYIVMVNPPRIESIQEIEHKKENLRNKWENLRVDVQNKKESFEHRLELEYEGFLDEMLKLGSRSLKKLFIQGDSSLENYNNLLALAEPLSWWNHLNGEPKGLAGLKGFYLSDTFKEIPIMEIKCKIIAKILTESSKVKQGDVMDIEQVSALLPYCNYMVLDRSMKHWLLNLKLDKKYNTNIFSISDCDNLVAALNNI